ncbi:unnamed protein product, partial [Coregonus sp. 'balchen']
VWLDPIGRSECSPDCRLLLQLAEEPVGSDITLNAIKNNATLETKTFHIAQCPIGWLASGRSCYSVSRRSLSWGDAQQTCMGVASRGHLVDLKTETDLLLSSYLTTHNNLLLLWTALNDRKNVCLTRTEREADIHWSDVAYLNSSQPAPQLYVQYQEVEEGEENGEEEKEREKRSAGRVSLSLRASHLTGAAWSLGSTHITHTRPLPTRNVTISNVTASQITVSWTAPDSQHAVRWGFLLQARRMGVASSSRSTVIGGLEGFRKYMVRVDSVTEHGVESCGGEELTIHTGERPDGYYVRLHPLNQARPRELWVNKSRCVVLGMFSPGQTYELGVASVRGGNKSQEISTTYTTEPGPVQVAFPLSVGSSSVVLYVQRPVLGVCDGVRKVCVPRAVFFGLLPSSLYHFFLTTENESFIDSPPSHSTSLQEVLLVEEDVTSSVFVSWGATAGGMKRYKLLLCPSGDK